MKDITGKPSKIKIRFFYREFTIFSAGYHNNYPGRNIVIISIYLVYP